MFAKTFDYELATICSWRGRKQNYKIENLKIIKFMSEAVHHLFPNITDHLMEQAGTSWFRSAQQRFARQKNV
ncbi:hypothetical protein RN001_001710 [Aquatica leii]|uniref:Uncharacterized protein n=1 Tax=Aquatica leii TaxID=1421715 RepID=A0AAN7Q4H6_9COLE|nr:hypothetical protein RN001_001710 [Aquatica leii]